MCIRVRILLLQTCGYRREVSLGLFERDTRFKAPDNLEEVRAALGCYRCFPGSIAGDRGPQLDRIVLDRKLETRRHDTNNRKRNPAESDRLIQYRGIGVKALLKECLAENHDPSCF